MKNVFFLHLVVVLSIFCLAAVIKAEPVLKKTIDLPGSSLVDPTTGFTQLMKAAKIGDLPSLKIAFENEKDINSQNKVGVTALMIAAKYGNEAAISFLLDNGARTDIKSNLGYTAADFARLYGHKDLVRLLSAKKSL